MHSAEFDELLLLADAGELAPGAAARLAAHEPGCPACRDLRAALASGRAAAAAAAVSLPVARLDAVAAAVRGQPAAPSRRPRGVLARLLAASALASVALLLARSVRGPEDSGGLERDLARLERQLAALETSWALEDPFSDLDADIRRLEESSARLRREVEGT